MFDDCIEARLSLFDRHCRILTSELSKSPPRTDDYVRKLACDAMRSVESESSRLGDGKASLVGNRWRVAKPGQPSFVGPFAMYDVADVDGLDALLGEAVFQTHRLATSPTSSARYRKFRSECQVALQDYRVVRGSTESRRQPPNLELQGKKKELVDALFSLADWDGLVGKVAMSQLLRSMYPGVDEKVSRGRLRTLKAAVLQRADSCGSTLWIQLGKDDAEIKV